MRCLMRRYADIVLYEIVIEFPEAATIGVLEKGVLKNFANFKGKYLCQGLFLNKVLIYFLNDLT